MDLGAGSDPLRSRVLGFAGADVVLALLAAPSARTREALRAGREGLLTVEHGDRQRVLRGTLRDAPGPGALVVRISDPFVGQRRLFSRAPLALPASVRPLDGAAAWATITRDVSAGGVRVERRDDARCDAARYELALTVAAADRRLVAEAELVRASERDISLRLVRINPADRALLAQLALDYYRHRPDRTHAPCGTPRAAVPDRLCRHRGCLVVVGAAGGHPAPFTVRVAVGRAVRRPVTANAPMPVRGVPRARADLARARGTVS